MVYNNDVRYLVSEMQLKWPFSLTNHRGVSGEPQPLRVETRARASLAGRWFGALTDKSGDFSQASDADHVFR
jgi:hypothetical protein